MMTNTEKQPTPLGLVPIAQLDDIEFIEVDEELKKKINAKAALLTTREKKFIIWHYQDGELYRDLSDHLAKERLEQIKDTIDSYKSLIDRYKIQPKNGNPEKNMDSLFGNGEKMIGVYEDGKDGKTLSYGVDFTIEDAEIEQGVLKKPVKVVFKDKDVDIEKVIDMVELKAKPPTSLKKLKWIALEAHPTKVDYENFLYDAQAIALVRNSLQDDVKRYFDGYLNNILFNKQDKVSSDRLIKKD